MHQPNAPADVPLEHHDVPHPRSGHARCRLGSREFQPVSGKIERGDDPAENMQGCAATAIGMWTADRPRSDHFRCCLLDFRSPLDGRPLHPMHSDLDGPNASEEVRLIGAWTHNIARRNAERTSACPKRKGDAKKRRHEDGLNHVMFCLFSWSGGLVPRASQASLRRDRLAFPWIFQSD